MTTAVTQVPGHVAGIWDIDPVHSDVSFTVRHMMVSKVRGRFATFSGEIITGADLAESTVNATIDRNDFGVDIKMPMDGGGVVVSDKVQITLEIEAVLRQS